MLVIVLVEATAIVGLLFAKDEGGAANARGGGGLALFGDLLAKGLERRPERVKLVAQIQSLRLLVVD